VPFVNAWFPPERRGVALGLFGMGMGGTAISALTTVKLVNAHSIHTPFLIVAIALAVYAVVAAVVLRDAPGRVPPSDKTIARLAATAKLTLTWQAAALYAVGFGGYVAFSVYLPTYLKNAYALTQDDAAMKMAGFVLLAVALRPIGGWLSDRFAAGRVLAVSFAVVVVFALYLFVVGRCLSIAVQARDTHARLLAGSLGLAFFVYVLVNGGMISGLLPVVGIPMPLISYGGTSAVSLLAGIGLVMAVRGHRPVHA